MKYLEGEPQELESDYPYKGKDGSCVAAEADGKVLVTDIHYVTPNSVSQLKAAIAQAPVSVTIEADQTVFQMYSGGIFDDASCGTSLDHAVTAVGYGSEDGQEYYIVRNSWGASWGDAGYIKMAAVDGEGICGIQMESVWASTN